MLFRSRKFLPDLILLDFIMPGMDGADVATELKKDPVLAGIPLVMVTALASNREMAPDGTCSGGGQIMLAKPVSLPNLIRCIESQIAQKGGGRR